MKFNYGDLIANTLDANQDWSKALYESLRGRVFFAALFGEALEAVSQARARGTRIEFREWQSFEERFDLEANARKIAFGWVEHTDKVKRRREGFPFGLVPSGWDEVVIVAPPDIRSVTDAASQRIAEAVESLFRAA
jgi:hypothetical protein